MAPPKLDAPELFFNRELSWLQFNQRVLDEGLSESITLMERLKFLAIVSSNLDEFFMIRVAGLTQQRDAQIRKRDKSGMTASEQLAAIADRVKQMFADQSAGIQDVLTQLRGHGLRVLAPWEWNAEQRDFLHDYFHHDIFPVLTPMALQELDPCPLLAGLRLHVAIVLNEPVPDDCDASDGAAPRVIVAAVPEVFPRFITIPAEEGMALARLEDAITAHASAICPGKEIRTTAVFRLTRDADVAIQEDEAADLLSVIESAVLERRRRAVVRVEVSSDADAAFKQWLRDWAKVGAEDVYEIDGMLDAKCLWELVGKRGFESLHEESWKPQQPRDLLGEEDLWQRLQEGDVLLIHPYESFDPVVELVTQAAADPGVLAIKQTLYRTSGDSPIIAALAQAAQSGKEVTVLVELKARFDEAQNVNWAKRLEDAGCQVIYGIAGLKTHAKALLIVRREGTGIQRYVHLATGNYNDKTAKLYSDVGLMTCDRGLAADVSAFFNLLTGMSETVGWSRLAVAPMGLRRRFIELIDREIEASTADRPGLIMVKVNSLEDQGICQALYRASQAGVQVKLNIRGICCLRPGVKGASDNVEVTSIVDRYLEHARIFYFANGGHEEIYMSSADWMGRNLDRRLELLFPIGDEGHCRRIVAAMETYFADNVKAQRLDRDGNYRRVKVSGAGVRAQETLYRECVALAHQDDQRIRFHPMTKPD